MKIENFVNEYMWLIDKSPKEIDIYIQQENKIINKLEGEVERQMKDGELSSFQIIQKIINKMGYKYFGSSLIRNYFQDCLSFMNETIPREMRGRFKREYKKLMEAFIPQRLSQPNYLDRYPHRIKKQYDKDQRIIKNIFRNRNNPKLYFIKHYLNKKIRVEKYISKSLKSEIFTEKKLEKIWEDVSNYGPSRLNSSIVAERFGLSYKANKTIERLLTKAEKLDKIISNYKKWYDWRFQGHKCHPNGEPFTNKIMDDFSSAM